MKISYQSNRQALFELDDKTPSKEEDAFHFVAYLPINGRLYELDGLKEGPIDLGAIPDGKSNTHIYHYFYIICYFRIYFFLIDSLIKALNGPMFAVRFWKKEWRGQFLKQLSLKKHNILL